MGFHAWLSSYHSLVIGNRNVALECWVSLPGSCPVELRTHKTSRYCDVPRSCSLKFPQARTQSASKLYPIHYTLCIHSIQTTICKMTSIHCRVSLLRLCSALAKEMLESVLKHDAFPTISGNTYKFDPAPSAHHRSTSTLHYRSPNNVLT